MEQEKYIILQAESTERLENLINEHSKNGYVPVGGICCEPVRAGRLHMTRFYQLMELKETKKEIL